MKSSFCKLLGCAAMVGLLTLQVACGGGSSSSNPVNSLSIQSGNWALATVSSVKSGSSVYLGGSITQSGSTVTALMHISGSTCFDITTTIPFTTSVSGNSATLTSNSINGQVITATLSGGGTTLSGNYSISGGCSNGDRGTVSGVLVPNITGTWTGSVSSGSTTTTVSTALTQAASPSSDGTFAVTGTATFTNSPCSRSGAVTSGFAAGPVVYTEMSTNDLDGGTGKLVYTGLLDNPSTATSMSGAYDVSSGLCSGDMDDMSLTKH